MNEKILWLLRWRYYNSLWYPNFFFGTLLSRYCSFTHVYYLLNYLSLVVRAQTIADVVVRVNSIIYIIYIPHTAHLNNNKPILKASPFFLNYNENGNKTKENI